MDPHQQLLASVNHVRNAFSAMYSPQANNQVVKHNEAIIQEFKNSLSPDAAVASARVFLAPILADQQIQGYEVLYALQLVSERILHIPPWSSHSDAVRGSLRALAVELVMHTNPARYGMASGVAEFPRRFARRRFAAPNGLHCPPITQRGDP